MEIIWELKQPTGTQRKRAAKACNDCKKRKRKCPHVRLFTHRRRHPSTGGTGNDERPNESPVPIDEEEPASPALDEPSREIVKVTEDTSDISEEPIRVGDFHTDSILTEIVAETPGDRADRPAVQDYSKPFDSSVTQLVGRKNTSSRSAAETIQRNNKRWQYDLRCEPKAWVADHYNYHDALQGLALPKETQDALVTTYISSLDAIVPIVDGGQLLRDYTMGRASPHLIRAICLTACKTKPAAPFLRLTNGGPTMSSHDFAKALFKDLEATIRLDLEPNRLTKTQILALMWLHHDDNRGMQKASAFLSQAIQEAFVLALHFENPHRPNRLQCTYLWWTLRALDRQNACLQGMPLIIADRDIDISRPPLQGDSRSQVTAIKLKLGDVMDEVMEIYRPFLQRRGYTMLDEFPSFAEITAGTDLSMVQESHQHYLEIWYHVLAMLSCRYSLPDTIPYKRRFRSAERVQQLSSYGRHASLPPLPMVPYAISLALTVTWRALKDCPQAMEELMSRISLLQDTLYEVGKWSPKAVQMSKLSRKLLHTLRPPSAAPASVSTGADYSPAEVAPHVERERGGVIGETPSTIKVSDGIWESPVTTSSLNDVLDGQHTDGSQFDSGSIIFSDVYNALSLGFGGNVDGIEAMMVPGMFDFSELQASESGDAFRSLS